MTKVVVIGGGIGGLTAAIAVRRAGLDVAVYEQASVLSEVGAGLGLFPNAVRVLSQIGLKPAIAARAVIQTHVMYRRWADGSVIGQVDERGLEQEFGEPHYTMHRADLMEVLKGALPKEVIHLGRRVVSVSQDTSAVRVGFADGSHVDADVVIAADGITSIVALELGLATKAVPSGYAVYRGLANIEAIPQREVEDSTAITVWLGPGKHFTHYWVRPGELLNVMAVVHSPERASKEVWNAPGDPAEVREFYPGWHRDVHGVLDAIENVTLFGLFHRLADDRWHSGRVALLGDAIHPMLPFVGQGAGMAMEDAVTLAVLLEDVSPAEIPDRLALYSQIRWERARRCQVIASEHGATWEIPDGPEQEARDARLSKVATEPGTFFAPSAWLYGHDPRRVALDALSGKLPARPASS